MSKIVDIKKYVPIKDRILRQRKLVISLCCERGMDPSYMESLSIDFVEKQNKQFQLEYHVLVDSAYLLDLLI